MNTAIDNLRAAIAFRAYADLVKANVKFMEGNEETRQGRTIKELERFFRSEWGMFCSFNHGEEFIFQAMAKAIEIFVTKEELNKNKNFV